MFGLASKMKLNQEAQTYEEDGLGLPRGQSLCTEWLWWPWGGDGLTKPGVRETLPFENVFSFLVGSDTRAVRPESTESGHDSETRPPVPQLCSSSRM